MLVYTHVSSEALTIRSQIGVTMRKPIIAAIAVLVIVASVTIIVTQVGSSGGQQRLCAQDTLACIRFDQSLPSTGTPTPYGTSTGSYTGGSPGQQGEVNGNVAGGGSALITNAPTAPPDPQTASGDYPFQPPKTINWWLFGLGDLVGILWGVYMLSRIQAFLGRRAQKKRDAAIALAQSQSTPSESA